MNKCNDPAELFGLINCLSLLEKKAAKLYAVLAARIDLPLIKSFMLEISLDSQKHSVLLKGIADTLPEGEWNVKECSRRIGKSWSIPDRYTREILQKDKIVHEDWEELSEKLTLLEGVMGEEYFVFVQMKMFETLGNEIQHLYHVDLGKVKSIFVNIMEDEAHHREILSTVKDLLKQEEQELFTKDPLIKYRELLK